MRSARHLLPVALSLTALAACGGGGPQNWSGEANTSYAARKVWKAPVVQTNAPRIGRQMQDANMRSIYQDNRTPGLRGNQVLSSVATPSRTGGLATGGSSPNIMPIPRLGMPRGGVGARSMLPNVGRRYK